MLASKYNNRIANFEHGFLLHEGKNLEKNIVEAIHYYKEESSSFNIQYAKNNLGIIYKHGYGNVKGRAGNAIVYFEEAIRQKNDYLSMYNLAHIYIYDETIKGDVNESIKLLIKSSRKFIHSFNLLCLLLIKQFGSNFEAMKDAIEKQIDGICDVSEILRKVIFVNSLGKSYFKKLYDLYKNIDFVYDIQFKPMLSSDLENTDKVVVLPKYQKDINKEFYRGFGIK